MSPEDNRDDPVRIGLTTYREPARWGVWDEPADLLPASYARAVTAAGAVAMLLPPGADAAVNAVLDGLHGVVISGGADVDPARYAAVRDPSTGPSRPDRDGWELALVRAALSRRLPVLAICRGLQVLNVALGGSLIQHLPDVVDNQGHCPTVGLHGRHPVSLRAGSRLGVALGERAEVATYHHQAIDRLGAGLEAVGWAEDGTIEAAECDQQGWTVGVQWHPEVFDGAPLFEAFVQAATAYRATPVGGHR
ncbi:MAG: gamma-glutamyl-gamma-aminobutyrate hydrolase family protein [Actinomycetota bacterium]|nr:gamma-glutamyl-gamma-aminobutyrate hydrolase family protein [Actinomycetota bacterium]MDQ2956378.1 gamma-glutamyl-gamma-aminobutyrate hydrolase family protein [Actinomycetota bacterium]